MPAATFDLDRLDPQEGRLVVAGRWSGVRGMRFVRPTLIVEGRPVLATLEHKPWAPVEGEPWIAAFPWADGPVDPRTATLAVAPSVNVPLEGGVTIPEPRVAPTAPPASSAPPRAAAPAQEPEPEVAEPERAPEPVPEPERARLHAELAEARLRIGRLEDELERVRDELAAARRDRDAERRRTERVLEERDDAVRGRAAEAAARAEALRARDEAVARTEAVAAERDAALDRRDDAIRHRDEALLTSETLERRLRGRLAQADRDDERPAPRPEPQPRRPAGDDEPLGVRAVPAARIAAPALHAGRRAGWSPSVLDLWVVRALGGTAALSFLLLLLTLLLTLT